MRILALLCVLFLCACCTLESTFQSVHASTLTLRITNKEGTGTCSGTAVSADTILTAAHCFRDLVSLKVNGRNANILAETADGHDHVLAVLDIHFDSYAHLGPYPAQGDRVFEFGNPVGTPDILAVGRVAGMSGGVLWIDLNGWLGCSGAGVFDSSGRIVGVISGMSGGDSIAGSSVGFKLIAVRTFNFSVADLKRIGA